MIGPRQTLLPAFVCLVADLVLENDQHASVNEQCSLPAIVSLRSSTVVISLARATEQ